MLQDMSENVDIGTQLQELFAEPDHHQQLRLYIAAHCSLFANAGDILRAAMLAIEDPDVAALADEGDRQRREVIETLTAQWEAAGTLRADLTAKTAADRLWLLTTVEGFLNATDRLEWKPPQYQEWLTSLAEAELLKPNGRT
jgi:plasmid stability protein